MVIKVAKYIKHILIFGLLLFLLYSIQWLWYPTYQSPFVQNPDLCLTYFKEGNLYGGDPYCFQGPVIYVLLFLFDFFFRSIPIGTTIFYFISLFVIGSLLSKIKEKETGKESIFFVYFITLFLFGKVFMTDFASIPATVFLLLGVYVLYYTESRWKYLVSGCLFSIAILSKPHNTPLVIAPAILFHFIQGYLRWRKGESITIKSILLFLKEVGRNITTLLLPLVVLFLLAVLFFNHFLVYNYIIHTYNPVIQTYSSMIKELVTFTYWYNGLFLLLYLGIFISALRLFFYRKFDLFSFVSCISFPLLILLVGNKFGLYKLIDQYRYILPLVPFYFMNIFCFIHDLKSTWNKKVFYCILSLLALFLFVLYLTLGGLTLFDILENQGINDQKIIDRIKYHVEMPLTFLPETEGKILTEYAYFHRYDLLFDDTPYKYVEESSFQQYYEQNKESANDPDMAVAGNFIKIGLLDSLTPYFHNRTTNRNILARDLQAGAYSIVFVGPYIDAYAIFLKKVAPPHSCRVSMPLLIEGNTDPKSQFFYIYFIDKEVCSSFKKTLQEYYTSEFAALCTRGEFFITIINASMSDNKTPLEQSCSNNSQLYLLNNRVKIESLFLCVLLMGYIAYGTALALRNHKRESTNNKTAAYTQSEETRQKD